MSCEIPILQALGELGRVVLEAVAGAGDVVEMPQILWRGAAAERQQRRCEEEGGALRHSYCATRNAEEVSILLASQCRYCGCQSAGLTQPLSRAQMHHPRAYSRAQLSQRILRLLSAAIGSVSKVSRAWG